MKTKQWKKVSMIISFLALAAIALSGCSGSNGAAGPMGPAGPAAGTSAATMSTETMAALNPTVTVDSVTIASPPVVKFTIKDAKGNGITGLGFTTQTATATVPTLSHFSFNLAKLVPSASGAPSKWVSYLVTTVPTKTTAGVAVPSVPTRPTTDAAGTLVDNGNGSYTYTFYRDITKIKDQVAAATFTGDNVLADLGDLTYDPKLIHRLVIRLSGNVRGTGSNTADGSDSGVTAVPLENPKVIVHDFIPAPYRVVAATDTQREITTNAACASCHYVTPGHRGADVRNCVMCHNDQIKYGRPKTTSALAAGTYRTSSPLDTPDATTGLVPGSMGVTGTKTTTTSTTTKDPLTGAYTTTTRYTPAAYVIDGETLGNFPIMIHKLHMGNLLNTAGGRWAANANAVGGVAAGGVGPQWRGPLLRKTGFGYNIMGYFAFQDMREYPLSPMNCRKCHVGETTAQLAAAPQANNWKTQPSRVGCGSCHDGINWATGSGRTLAGDAGGHVGGAAANDSLCVVCHANASTYHITEASTPLNPEVWSDAAGTMATITRYELDSVTVPAVAPFYPTVVFRIMEKIGTADWKFVTLNTLATASQGTPGVDGTGSAAMYLANSGTAAGGSRTGFSGGPTFLIHWSTTGGVDWDNFGSGNTRAYPGLPSAHTNAGVYLVDLITGTGGTISGPDATGHYTAVLKSANSHKSSTGAINTVAEAAALAAPTVPAIDQAFPAGAKLRTVQMLGNFGQRNLGAPYVGVSVTIPSPAVIKSVTGEERRSVFTMAKCQACHEAGYGNESDGGGHATPGDFASCITCHNPMMAGNGTAPTATSGFTRNNVIAPEGWNFKSLMHFKHAEANKMGSLNRCEKCHLTTASYSSVPAGALPTTNQVVYAAPGTGTVSSNLDLITSPYASACLACHSNPDAANHAKTNGAVVNQVRTDGGTIGTNYSATVPLTKFVSTESCGTCHGVGKTYDVVKIHAAIAAD